MKKIISLCLGSALVLTATGCSEKAEIKNTIDGNMRTYYEMTDGTWTCDDISYKYRLEIKGRLSNAVRDSVFVYLSNIENISFEQAWKAGGLSSNSEDYFAPEEAVLVELGSADVVQIDN